MHRRRQQVVSTVDAETLVILNQVIDETNLSLGKVIDLIVQQWRKKEIIDPFKSTSESQDLSVLQNTLDNIDARLSWIEDQLADAHVIIVENK